MNHPALNLTTVAIRYEPDVVLARQRARQLAGLLGFDVQEGTRIATSVSEVARNAFQYAGGGRVDFALLREPGQFLITVRDEGAGIANVADVLSGRYRSQTGMGLGLVGARRLMDRLDVETGTNGTTVRMSKRLPGANQNVTTQLVARISDELARYTPQSPFEEIQQQNQELLSTLDELRARQAEVERLNAELKETNRGVTALYSELDDKAERLRAASESKSRFLANMSHEFRTPLAAIISLTHLLEDRTDGDLTPEQEKQVGFIGQSARDLLEIVNDLLDLAKIEAGRITVNPATFTVAELFGAIRGMFRPLLTVASPTLTFGPTDHLPALHTDEGKVAQILRNFLSNALKFTPHGEIEVSCALSGGEIIFTVRDMGIGIAPEHLELIFEEFAQIESETQRAVKGTGLGLPLCRLLAQMLGGRLWVESAPDVGSTFFAAIPLVYAPALLHSPENEAEESADAANPSVLPDNDAERSLPDAPGPVPQLARDTAGERRAALSVSERTHG